MNKHRGEHIYETRDSISAEELWEMILSRPWAEGVLNVDGPISDR